MWCINTNTAEKRNKCWFKLSYKIEKAQVWYTNVGAFYRYGTWNKKHNNITGCGKLTQGNYLTWVSNITNDHQRLFLFRKKTLKLLEGSCYFLWLKLCHIHISTVSWHVIHQLAAMNCNWILQLLWHTILELFNPSSFRVDDNSLQFYILSYTSVKITLQRRTVHMIIEGLSLQNACAKCFVAVMTNSRLQ